jgi:hypothetical protein
MSTLSLTSAPQTIKMGNALTAEIAQLVEHATENRGVHSSILCLGTNRLVR